MSVIDLTDNSFKDEALSSDVLCVVDFWAPWCGPCKMIGPIIEELAGVYEGKVKMCRVNVDENPDVASQYHINSIPTLLFIKNGEVADQQVGLLTKPALKDKIDSLI